MKKIALTTLLALACGTGCAANVGSPVAKASDEMDVPVDGKLDGWSITDAGAIEWEAQDDDSWFGSSWGTLSAEHRANGWTFHLSGDANVILSLEDDDDVNLDTVMYVYRQGANGSYGRYIERNDDRTETDLLSEIDADFEAGDYRVVVKGYSRADVGEFTLSSTCVGSGCAPE